MLTVGVSIGSLASLAPIASAQTVSTNPLARTHMGASHDARMAMMLENQAKLLGITVDDLKVRQAQGKSFVQITQDLGITKEQLEARMKQLHDARVTEIKAQIQAQVTNGKITQAQADKRIAQLDARVQKAGDRKEKQEVRMMKKHANKFIKSGKGIHRNGAMNQ